MHIRIVPLCYAVTIYMTQVIVFIFSKKNLNLNGGRASPPLHSKRLGFRLQWQRCEHQPWRPFKREQKGGVFAKFNYCYFLDYQNCLSWVLQENRFRLFPKIDQEGFDDRLNDLNHKMKFTIGSLLLRWTEYIYGASNFESRWIMAIERSRPLPVLGSRLATFVSLSDLEVIFFRIFIWVFTPKRGKTYSIYVKDHGRWIHIQSNQNNLCL